MFCDLKSVKLIIKFMNIKSLFSSYAYAYAIVPVYRSTSTVTGKVAAYARFKLFYPTAR